MLVCTSLMMIEIWRSWNARSLQLHETEIATSNLARALSHMPMTRSRKPIRYWSAWLSGWKWKARAMSRWSACIDCWSSISANYRS
ncbi:diguanylate cyclase domain protein [Collimonas arenae]|nr:diguanylate cyclase domain protein [Collimonas arenae]